MKIEHTAVLVFASGWVESVKEIPTERFYECRGIVFEQSKAATEERDGNIYITSVYVQIPDRPMEARHELPTRPSFAPESKSGVRSRRPVLIRRATGTRGMTRPGLL